MSLQTKTLLFIGALFIGYVAVAALAIGVAL